ncbi:CAMK/CAMKL/PASK protein kinase [Cryptococcus wingfieldii CBS 7118]|uniref:CAMK/CAMKL/PASK protein kinase n=1 Tax=Cryptococcus wingfieldii CBS 7118 TaxID=1295528 RepID=A0A1E3J4J6_9TREE|nr:CAMK/CAMKL/PASK protein kinase [Cryptococcus wingfieldii CBS 7118]ODN95767.1 CAMK/CAMKL/PASK protein kinase [Cryptococcus wingfieldii CBS 7118]
MVVTAISPVHPNHADAADALKTALSPISPKHPPPTLDYGLPGTTPPDRMSPTVVTSSPTVSGIPGRDESAAGPSSPRPIPPPPNARRHRSGILMSRVRASGSATRLQGDVSGSKSHGDLVSMAAARRDDDEPENGDVMEHLGQDTDEDDDDFWEGYEGRGRFRPASREGWKRVMSEGRHNSDGESFWDNSARYYHHLHSGRNSQSPSICTSPDQSPVASHTTSPIFVRRNLSLPQNGSAGVSGSAKSLSPNQHFLQSHLPPTFPSPVNSGTSPDTLYPEYQGPAAMVFTPTTQEWKDLQETPEWIEAHGERVDANFASSDEDDSGHSRHHSLEKDEGERPRRILKKSISAEYLGPEETHTPDPGSPPSGDKSAPLAPVYQPNIIAPSPVMAANLSRRCSAPLTLGSPAAESPGLPDGVQSTGALGLKDTSACPTSPVNQSTPTPGEADPDDVILNPNRGAAPARWNSIGRRDSLRSVTEKEAPPPLQRAKTKRELEREKLLKMVDEELEAEHEPAQSPGWGGGVQSIGKGFSLDSARSPGTPPPSDVPTVRVDPDALNGPSSEDPAVSNKKSPPNPFESHFTKKLGSKQLTSPFKPSPLNASPIVAPEDGSVTPSTAATTPAADVTLEATTQFNTRPTTESSSETSTGLDSIRDYTRGIAGSQPPKPGDITPPKSPRVSSRKRDTNRVSLVAGRVVRPFALPPSTALPPSARAAAESPALQSFSPFISPNTAPSTPATTTFPRLDSHISTISTAPSTGVPSECGTPTEEKAAGIGGRGIDDYVILKEAGKGAYGLVMRAKVKGLNGQPVGDEVIIKYIIKARILADCWKKHKTLGPIPVEIHVMDQLRQLIYTPPKTMNPWDPARPRPGQFKPPFDSADSLSSTPVSPGKKDQLSPPLSTVQKHITDEIKTSPRRGHPNICKLVDFFEDREFYYLVMPRFGTGLDLFDRVETRPLGLDAFEIRSLAGQLIDAVNFLHINGIVHRDIKDENVILDGSGHCQLIDFGSAAHWRPGKKWDTFSGTLHYASPEILRGDMYGGKEQDVWALGVVFYVLLVAETPFSEIPDEVLKGLEEGYQADTVLMARCGNGHEEEGLEDDGGGRLGDAADLVRRCMEIDAANRPGAETLLKHRYLKGAGGWTGRKGWIEE